MEGPNRLPQTARDLFKLPPSQHLLYFGSLAFCEAIGAWKYPMRAYGDLERMRFIDKLYWMYKTTHPIRRARRGSDLEAYFAPALRRACALPAGFRAESRLRISAAGDLMNHPFLAQSAGHLYQEVREIVFGVDVAMANLECPVVTEKKKDLVLAFDEPPSLYFDGDQFAAVRGIDGRQFDFVSTACNHSLDHGVEGVESTLGALETAGMHQNGLNGSEERADTATVIEANGFRLGVLAYTFGLNAHRPPADRPHIVNVMALNDGVAANDFARLSRQLAHCKAAQVDFVVAQLHWGFEHECFPAPEQVEVAHHLAELGVDLIIGHHPHILQPYEVYQTRRDDGRRVPIYYSLGNLVNPFTADYLCRSGVAQVQLARGTGPDGERVTWVESAGLDEVIQVADVAAARIRLRRAA